MDAAELEWIAWTTPITTSLGTALAASDFSGRTAAWRQRITAATICIVTPFVEAGARARDRDPQLFDLFAPIMLLALDVILSGQTADLPNGVQRYPRPLEARVARAVATGSA